MTEDAVVLAALLAVGVGILLCALRVLAGPTGFDRALALDTIGLQCVAAVVLLSIHWRTAVYFDLALLLALLGFIVTLSVARFLGGDHGAAGP